MLAQRILVTYYSSPLFLSTDHWKHIHSALLRQFPLRTLHRKSPNRTTIQTIPELDVELVSLESLRDEHTSQIPQTLLEKPLLNIYLVVCEDNETYKNNVRKQVKDWHTSISQRKSQEWLIVHIVRPDEKSTQGRIFQMKASVLDKIRADFNVEKKDRCVQLVWSTDYENPAAWAELINKMKEGILSAFEAAFMQREEEVKRSESQRQMPGWNFCTFFILKESLSISLEGMSLYEDALEQYNELEASFFRVLPLLSITKKPYRDLILANSISVFDFRIYLLARQCALLNKLGRVIEICRKAVAFLSGFGRRLRELEDSLPLFFVESWTYSSALSVVDLCDSWANSSSMSKTTLARFNAVKGELLELAQQQLDIIGIRTGHLPSRPPFSIALPVSTPSTVRTPRERSSQKISRAELLTALGDKDAFYDLYVKIANRAIELYANAGRRKFALKLHGNLAALDVIRDRLPNAFETYKSLPAHYAPHGWTSLESFMRLQALTVHASVGKAQDAEWIHILLEFLKAYVEDMGKELLVDVEDHKSYIEGLVFTLRDAAGRLESDLLHPDHPALSVVIADTDVRLAESQDGALLDVVVRNHLPCDFPVDEVSVILVGYEGSQLLFSKKIASLAHGTTTLALFCPSYDSGQAFSAYFRVEEVEDPAPTKGPKSQDHPTLVRIPKDLRSLDVRLQPPQLIELGTPPKIMVSLRTGRNDISTITLRLSAPSGVQFKFDQITFDGLEHHIFATTEETITLHDIGKEKDLVMRLPHSDASSYHTMRVNVNVEYITASEPNITRRLKLARFVPTSLPMSVNVEDFFRGTRLFTRFTLSVTSHQHVRIRSIELRPSGNEGNGVNITGCHSQKPAIVTVTPAQSGKFLFQLDSLQGKSRDPMKLRITYRTLREEVEALIDQAVAEVVTESPFLLQQRALLVDRLVEALSNDAKWIELYGVTGELVVPDIPDEEDDIRTTLRRLKEILADNRYTDISYGEWRDIIIPVDVPQMHILAAAQLRVLANPFSTDPPSGRILPLFAGQSISATVTVSTSFYWAPLEDVEAQSYLMRYDIEDMMGDWLVSGRKRGDFTATDGSTFTTPVTLIALRHGELSLPPVAVTALPLLDEKRMRTSLLPSCETYQVHGAEKVLVLPRGGRTTYVVDMGRADSGT